MTLAALIIAIFALILALVAVLLCCFILGRASAPVDAETPLRPRAPRLSRQDRAEAQRHLAQLAAEHQAETERARAMMRAEFPELGYEEELIGP